MTTEDLIKESHAETSSAMETSAKNVESLIDTVRNLRAEVTQLTEANMKLRAQILDFKNWTNDRLSQISEKAPTPIIGPQSGYLNDGAKKGW